mgnify:CR=1 FL=1
MERKYAVEFIVDIAKELPKLETIVHILEEYSDER